MATPTLALDPRGTHELSEQEEMETREDAQRASSRLLESQREEIKAEIAHAESILDRHDMEGQEDLYSRETLDRAVAFLKAHIEWVWRSYGTKAPTPTIGPGPRGTVDLYWKRPSFELLVNIPASADGLGTFYGRDNGQQTAKGSFDPKRLTLSIATWLMM
jgi:hypothetical protein